jgi:hypothetical protein
MDTKSTRVFWVALGMIVLFSLIGRLWVVSYNLPELQVSDENSDLSTTLRLTNGELPERHVRFHRSLIAYVNGGAVGGLFVYSFINGDVAGISDFQNLYFSDRHLFTLATRLVLVGLNTLSVLLVGLTGRYIHQRVGLLSALLLALNGFFVFASIHALPDSLIIFAVALFLWLTMRLWFLRRPRDFLAVGIALSLIMYSKFSAVTIGIGLAVVYIALIWSEITPPSETTSQLEGKNWQRWLRAAVLNRRLLVLILGFILGAFLLNPLPYLYPDDLVFEIQRLARFAYADQLSLSAKWQTIRSHLEGMIIFVWRWQLLASLLGIVAVIRYRKNIPYWSVLSVFAIFFITIGNITTNNYKIFYWTPFLAPMALISGVGLATLLDWGNRRRLGHYGAYILVLLVILAEFAFMSHISLKMNRQDTRQLAAAYIKETIPPGSRILLGSTPVYTAPLQRNGESIERASQLGATYLETWKWWLEQPPATRPEPSYNLYGTEFQAGLATFTDVQQLISDEAIEYVIEADFSCQPKSPTAKADLEFPALDDDLRNQWELVKTFSPFTSDKCVTTIDSRFGLVTNQDFYAQERLGPFIRIYRTGIATENG